ncbi:hypothetical protein GQR58_016491 [Nymphon striatum]|nr:hypothetical protein GQR58_016491 [Nymphon striatum]
MAEKLSEDSRNVTVNLKHRVGKYVNVTMIFASTWMLISEVVFNSEILNITIPEESGPYSKWSPSNPGSINTKKILPKPSEGLLSYKMPKGQRWKSGVYLDDLTYNGVLGKTIYYGGVGQLVDGKYGSEILKIDSDGNLFLVLFGVMSGLVGVMTQEDPSPCSLSSIPRGTFLRYDYMEDTFLKKSRNVTVNLMHRIGKYVKVTMKFASKWILLSEVTFYSVELKSNITDEAGPYPIRPAGVPPGTLPSLPPEDRSKWSVDGRHNSGNDRVHCSAYDHHHRHCPEVQIEETDRSYSAASCRETNVEWH